MDLINAILGNNSDILVLVSICDFNFPGHNQTTFIVGTCIHTYINGKKGISFAKTDEKGLLLFKNNFWKNYP